METKEKARKLEPLFKMKDKLEEMMNDTNLTHRMHDLSFDMDNSSIRANFYQKLWEDHKKVSEEIESILEKPNGKELGHGTQFIIFDRVQEQIKECESDENPLDALQTIIKFETKRYLDENK